jgi:signal transduction histidine kinase
MALAEMLGAGWISGLMHVALPMFDRWSCGWIGWAGYVLLLGLSSLHARIFMNTAATDKLADQLLKCLAIAWLLALPLFAIFQPYLARQCLLIGGTVHALVMLWLSQRSYAMLSKKSRAHMHLFMAVWFVYAASGLLYVVYRVIYLPVYVTLITSFVQGSLVAALMGCAVSVQVIRQRRGMQESVARMTDRNHLYAAAHHDLLQPIQSVGLYAAALSAATEAQRARFLRGIESAVTSVHDFMEGLRQVDIPANVQVVNLHQLLIPLIEEYRLIASHKHISLRYHPSHIMVQTDPALMQRMVRNLLSNSIRYTNKGGGVLLGCRRYGGRRWLMVYDNGIGMTPEQLKVCFDAFVRVGDISSVPEGMGLGLYSVKRIAAQLNSQTRLSSKINVGAAVGISLD